MGSGCNVNAPTKKNCTQVYSTDCAIWQGKSVPLLGICCGDTVTEVETAIIERLLTVLDGTGIDLSAVDLRNCVFLLDLIGNKDKNLFNLIQMLVDADCNLKKMIDDINKAIAPTGNNYVFDFLCFQTPTGIKKTEDVVQFLIKSLCDLKKELDQLKSDTGGVTNNINTTVGNFLLTAINSAGGNGIRKEGTGKDVKITITGMPPPGTALPYTGSLNIFDNTGKGIAGTPGDGWYIYNGLNETPDYRGYTFMGATEAIPGGPLDPRVDPVLLNDAQAKHIYNEKKGEVKHKLTVSELPSFTPSISSATGTVSIPLYQKATRHQDSNSSVTMYGPDNSGGSIVPTSLNGNVNLNISMNSIGGDLGHNNIPPVFVGVWIGRKD